MSLYQQRRQKLRRQHKIPKQVALLITNLVNVKYLTGFGGSSGWLLVTANDERLLSDTRYETQLAQECPDLECDIRNASETQMQALVRVVKKLKYQAIQYESEALTKAAYDGLADQLGVELVSTQKVVEQIRAIKDATEIETIRKAIQINQRVFEIIKCQLTADQTELEIAHELENQMRRLGASGVAFDPIVAVGERSALPHARPSSHHRVGESPILLLDWGTKFGGYMSDLTRVLVTGKVPSKFRKIYDTVLAAQRTAIEAIRPGVSLKSVDQAARGVIEKAGFGKFFGHGLGHSFGLEIHENPMMNPISEGELSAGMVITVEPGIYLPGFGGVRIEDDVLVTHNGGQVLSDLPKEFDDCVVSLV